MEFFILIQFFFRIYFRVYMFLIVLQFEGKFKPPSANGSYNYFNESGSEGGTP